MKKSILFIASVIPLLSSCRGAHISPDRALEVIDNIINKINDGENKYEKFTYKYSSTYGDQTTYIKVTFDGLSQFYNRYEIIQGIDEEDNPYYKTNEYWSYVKDGKFYDLVRYNGAKDDAGEPLVTYVTSDGPVDYKDEYWMEKNDLVISELQNNYLMFALYNVENLAKYKSVVNNANITFYTKNDTSISTYGEADLVKFDYKIEKLKITYLSFEIDDKHKKEFTCNYNRAQITYLNL